MMLARILETAERRSRVAHGALAEFKSAAQDAPDAIDLAAALSAPGMAVIAEIKRRSPSAGDIDARLNPAEQARKYVDGGADAISVLTEPEFFGGSLEDLRVVRESVDVPVLRKDFTRNAAQIWEARAAGADAVLLIVAALTPTVLRHLIRVAGEVGVAALVEVHTVDEVAVAVEASASVIGVNNRDLKTFVTDLSVAEQAADSLPQDVVRVAESGVSTPAGAARMAAAGYDAILVGEALVRADDPTSFVAALKAGT